LGEATAPATLDALFGNHDGDDRVQDDLTGLPADADAIVVSGLTADSRAVKPSTVFAALAGSKVDGAVFVDQAVAAGAVAVLAGHSMSADPGVPVLRSADPRRTLAIAAARFYRRQPQSIAAITGTNGKTSVAVFLRQIWAHAGFRAASLGTIGLVGPDGAVKSGLTTPDPVSLHENLAQMADAGVTHLALEASSHGLVQRRLDGVRISAAGFTNLSRDHLDYHGDVDAYRAAKMRLFAELLPDGQTIVVDADEAESAHVMAIAEARKLTCLTTGKAGRSIRVHAITRMTDGVRLIVEANTERRYLTLPLVGSFQISNALVAAGLAVATGVDMTRALDALEHLKGVPGRLEMVGHHRSGARIFVDFAHTPEALVTVLSALRHHSEGRLIVVFGAGGERDRGKRSLMGEAAQAHADHVIVTDDNPRDETPADIRAAIMTGASRAEEIPGRQHAIRTAIAQLRTGDILLIAGKGHETGQEIGGIVHPFSDQDEVRSALAILERAS